MMMTENELDELLEFMKDLALRSGALAEGARADHLEANIDTKNDPRDIVTAADKMVEEFIIKNISSCYPDHGIFGEESGKRNQESSYCWIIDPIDGTTSYAHNAPTFSTSIALFYENKPLAGAVYAPRFKELYYARKGKGAYCNGVRLSVTDHDALEKSVVTTGFSCLRAEWKDNNLPFFCAIAPIARDIRKYGSAALDCCWLAAGKQDAFWELNLQLYDYAAGILILTEAGGICTDLFGGDDLAEKGFLATNKVLHKVMLPFFKDYKATRK